MLGLAIGVSIADGTDMAAVGRFLGSLLAAKLSGHPDATLGMLNGVTLWSVGTTLMVV